MGWTGGGVGWETAPVSPGEGAALPASPEVGPNCGVVAVVAGVFGLDGCRNRFTGLTRWKKLRLPPLVSGCASRGSTGISGSVGVVGAGTTLEGVVPLPAILIGGESGNLTTSG